MIYTKEVLEAVVAESTSWVEVIRRLGKSPRGGGLHRWLKHKAGLYGIDSSHFTGRGWAKGVASTKRKTPDQILVQLDPTSCRRTVDRVRESLLEIGREHRCAVCGLGPSWQGSSLTLQVDHINGDSTNNTAENLRFLCPNCHSQTVNFGGNARRGRPATVPGARLLNE